MMNLTMSGLDYCLAPLELREKLAFTKSQIEALNTKIALTPGVRGCVLISTCNRTEIYLSVIDGANIAPDQILCQTAGVDFSGLAHAFVTRQGEEVATHLMQVASGLKSQIWGEDQILSQVKTAIQIAREENSADGLLETVFRTAISAGKEVKSKIRLSSVPVSAAHYGVLALERAMGALAGKKAMVIGNGEMGRLAATLLRDRGCAVTVTLRTYRHGETLVPAGCSVTPYEERYEALSGQDILISATTSPHHTIALQDYLAVPNPPKYLVDLAVPRDISPELGDVPDITLFHIDNMNLDVGANADPQALAQARNIQEEHLEKLRHWCEYRSNLTKSRGDFPRFPLFVDLSGKKVVVIGGGAVACRRIAVLLQFGGEITVISPHWEKKLEGVTWIERPYQSGDLQGAALVVAATDDRLVNAQVGEEATGLSIPVSVADDASACTFFFPAVCVGGGVVAGAVSTDGAHHSRTAKAAKAIRKKLEELEEQT